MKTKYVLAILFAFASTTSLAQENETQSVSATLNGDAVGNAPATKTNDHWYNVLFGVGLTF